MPPMVSAEPCSFGILFAFPTSPDSAHVEWTYEISTENVSEEFQFGSKHLVCRATECHCTTAERLAQKPIVIWKTVWVGLFVINCDFLWRDTYRMSPASQRLVEPRMLAVLHTQSLETASSVIAMKHASSIIKVIGKSAHFAAEIGKLGRRLEVGTLISPNTFRNNITRQGYAYFLKLGGTCLRNLLQGVSGVFVNIDTVIAAHTTAA